VIGPSTSDRPAYVDQLAATVEEIGRLQWTLGQVVTPTDDARAVHRAATGPAGHAGTDRPRAGSVRAAVTER
jgi:hypothetical protein